MVETFNLLQFDYTFACSSFIFTNGELNFGAKVYLIVLQASHNKLFTYIVGQINRNSDGGVGVGDYFDKHIIKRVYK